MVVYKQEKENFEKIARFMTDEDFNERNVFKVNFQKLNCYFQICRSFSKINNSKINGTQRGRENSLPKNILKYCI